MNSRVAASAATFWWQADVIVLFGVTVPILPMFFGMVALWVGREIARDRRKELARREKFFLNVGLALVTFLVITGKIIFGHPLEVGWATVMGFGIGMNGFVIFEIFQRFVLSVLSNAFRQPPADTPSQ